jgi:hypothetical protein
MSRDSDLELLLLQERSLDSDSIPFRLKIPSANT